MRLWLLIIGVLFVQELASTNVILLDGYRAGYSAILIAVIFVIATTLDLAIGYAVGKYVQRSFGKHRLIKKLEGWTARFESYLGPKSERAMLVLIGLVSYAYVNAFLVSWLTLAPAEALLWLAFGDLIWYCLEWLLILGAASLTSNFANELYILVGTSLALIIVLRFVSRKIFRS